MILELDKQSEKPSKSNNGLMRDTLKIQVLNGFGTRVGNNTYVKGRIEWK